MNRYEMRQFFIAANRNRPRDPLTAHIVLDAACFEQPYSLLQRTYAVTSDSEAFMPGANGRCVMASCLDKTRDQNVQLDLYGDGENGRSHWELEDCYILELMQDVDKIENVWRVPKTDGTACYILGATCINAREHSGNGKIRLEAISGSQSADQRWYNLSIDKSYAYCTLLERQLNKKEEQA